MKYVDQLKTKEWKDKRDIILFRDNHSCQVCNNKNRLQVHHKEYLPNRYAWEYEDDYLITLCNRCHLNLHKKNKAPERFVRMFEKGMNVLLTLNKSEYATLLASFKFTEWETNEIAINARRRKDIKEMTGLTINTVNCSWSKLKKLKLFITNEGRLYLNPDYFFFGSDEARFKLRKLLNKKELPTQSQPNQLPL